MPSSLPMILDRLPTPVHWLLLITLSALFAAVLEGLQLPAALLLGPMLAAIVAQNIGTRVKVPPQTITLAQAVIGCLIARAITPAILHTVGSRWPLFIGITFATLALSGAIGYAVASLRIVPGTTAIWGLLPGGASTMVLMADAFGADARLVAFMQYTRVLFVTVIASVLARLMTNTHGSPAAALVWFPLVPLQPFAETVALIAFGLVAGRASRLPNGTMLLPMLVGSALHGAGLITVELPPWLLAVAYLGLGWSIGLRFTRAVIASAGRALVPTLLSIFTMIVFSGGLAVLLVEALGTEPLAAYLATSPGGADSVAIIAASSHVDSGFVMAFQTSRLLAVMLFGPLISRYIATHVIRRDAVPAAAAAGTLAAHASAHATAHPSPRARDESERLGTAD